MDTPQEIMTYINNHLKINSKYQVEYIENVQDDDYER